MLQQFKLTKPQTQATKPVVPNTHLDPEWLQRSKTVRQKVRDTLTAIETVKALQTGKQERTDTDAQRLSCYWGMGVMTPLFKVPVEPAWVKDAEQLQALLTDEEYAKVRSTINTAYYTPTYLIDFIYRVLARFGVRGGNFLELGCGPGWFLGLAPQAWKVKWTGVETEPISAAIAAQLYPQAVVVNRPIERTRLAFDFDVAVGNVPFSEVVPYDPQSQLRSLGGVHDYCLMREIEALRRGGLGAVLTSIGTLQSKKSQPFREWAAQRVRLIAALKLPMGALSESSNTDASSDLLIFQKLQEDEEGNADEWVNLVESPIVNEETQEPFLMNQWFQSHPEHLLGKLGRDKLYGAGRLALEPEGDVEALLAGVLERLPQQIYEAPRSQKQYQEPDTKAMPLDMQETKPFAFVWHENEPWQCRDGILKRVKVKGTARKRLWWLIMIKEAARNVVQVQWESDDDEQLKKAQKRLERLYDEFTGLSNMGWLHSQGNSNVFGNDPDYPLLLALETWDPDYPELTRKADIFSRRTIKHVQSVDKVESAAEALVQSNLEQGRIDLEYMSHIYGKPVDEILVELQKEEHPLVFHDPVTQQWVSEDEYLSGNVRERLEKAELAARTVPNYLFNVKALQAVQLKPVEPGKIYARLGSPWLPPEIIVEFIRYVLELPATHKVTVYKNPRSSKWTVEGADVSSLLNTSEYGTDRVSAAKLIAQALNQKTPVVYDTHHDTTTKNQAETRKAMVKQDRLKDLFKRWVWQDWERATRLAEIYNRDFNCFRRRKFNGSHLIGKIKGISEVWQQRLSNPKRLYQYNTIWRMVKAGNTLVQHPTGAGKTAIAIVASQLMRQYQLCYKPCLVVLDHLVLQQAAEAVQIYPGLQVLTISTKDLEGARKRQEFQARIGTGAWDLVVCSQTALKMLSLLPETINKFVADAVEAAEDGFYNSGRNNKRGATKNLEKAKDRAKQKTEAAVEGGKRDQIYFEHTGIGRLFIDESQEYLGLQTNTQMTGVLGVMGSVSQKAQDLYYKSRYLAETYGEGKCMYLLTATPIRNTLGQFWVNLKFLCPQVLEQRGIAAFDDAISVFAEAKTSVEITAAGILELKTRLASWSNKPEMQALWFLVSDLVKESELDIEKPECEYIIREVPASPSQLKFFDSVAERARSCRGKRIKKGDDNIPWITSDVKQGVIDLRLLPQGTLRQFLTDEEIGGLGDEFTKARLLLEDVYESWAHPQHQEEQATQLIFCDAGTPNTEGRFSSYRWWKQQLIEKGVPESEIAFAHDATTDQQKADMTRKFRQGVIRILFGSTRKLGAGTHFPDRLLEVRHVDCPLRPIDRWQRDGRQIRPGNRYKKVRNYSYVTTGKPYQNEKHKTIQGLSPDSYLYEVNLRKANFILAGFYEESDERTMEDIDETTLDFATLVATATGDPRFKEKVALDNTISGLLLEELSYQGTQAVVKQKLHTLPRMIDEARARLERYESDRITRQPTSAKQFSITLNGTVFKKRAEAGEALQAIADASYKQKRDGYEDIGTFAEFQLMLQNLPVSNQTLLHLKGKQMYTSVVRDTPKGTLQALEAALDNIEKQITETTEQLEQYRAEQVALQPIVNKPFEQAAALEAALKRQEELNRELGVVEQGAEDAATPKTAPTATAVATTAVAVEAVVTV
ncbi:DNA methylase [Leptolyngbya sp. FACHB-321]|uniref:DNA methylase n=1 Tax=Leptolyngbya sp. FACHB-321 TaxID=2692807 RepID=UPI00168891B5|nr:DNA methylase [Leptolyngbya sp. FACHB-321]MBD2034517.1 DNA methylase [Leptolyngbya sp. FACHB-321]